MTVKNHAIPNSAGRPILLSGTLAINALLLAILVSLLLAYVLLANSITASNYQVRVLDDKISALTEAHSILAAKQTEMDTESVISSYAQAYNMVEAREASYMFENGDVALQR